MRRQIFRAPSPRRSFDDGHASPASTNYSVYMTHACIVGSAETMLSTTLEIVEPNHSGYKTGLS